MDDGRGENLWMHKCIELEAVSTADGCDQFVDDGRNEILLDRSRVHHADRRHNRADELFLQV